MKYTFRSEKELQEVIQAYAGIPQKVIDNAKYHIGLVEECFEDGACGNFYICLLYTSPSPRDGATSRMPSSA